MGRNPHKFHLNQIPYKVKAQLLAFIYERMSSPQNSSGQHSPDRTQAIWGLFCFKVERRNLCFLLKLLTKIDLLTDY
jgi:hypothetical protein